jgi:hypothetical protein
MYEVNSLDVLVTCRDASEFMIHFNDLVRDLEIRSCAVS